ncbi:hypothetical protein B0H17DRAFT_1196350 [Mycena rosella]|uniref:Uncharacterized protein n=1 Tax=Mycena rosella TaxID=1033263 RepID=A0AAD7GKQ1_MYCRO|nr:hypothetical protein B0H17DRAFT_1196350 [Mycena rosella]
MSIHTQSLAPEAMGTSMSPVGPATVGSHSEHPSVKDSERIRPLAETTENIPCHGDASILLFRDGWSNPELGTPVHLNNPVPIVDGHGNHPGHGLIMPPPNMHELQPCDPDVFEPLMAAWKARRAQQSGGGGDDAQL